MKQADLEGTWGLVAWSQEYDDGRQVHPMGEDPTGFITYTPDRRVMVLVTAGDRRPFATGGQWNADIDERARAYDTCLAYGGTYELAEDRVRHHIQVSLYPNWVGNVQVRTARITDGELHLTARFEEGTGQARTARLAWRRLPA